MKAIVTGGDGFVGSAVVKELLSRGDEVLAIDLAPTPRRLPKNVNLLYISHSIEDPSFLLEEYSDCSYDIFYHFAWRGSAGAERCDEKVQLGNAIQAAQCLRVASQLGCKKFVFAGTITEFETNEVVYQQGSCPSLPYIYGAGKIAAHEICKPIANSLGIDLVWGYITNCYGVGEASPRLLNTTLRKVIRHEKLEFTAGNQNYDFIYIDDVAKAFCLLGEKGLANKSYIIGSGGAKPLKDFLTEAIQEIAPECKPVFGALPYSGVETPLSVFDIAEIRNDCGFEPSVSFSEGVHRTFEWIKQNEGNQ